MIHRELSVVILLELLRKKKDFLEVMVTVYCHCYHRENPKNETIKKNRFKNQEWHITNGGIGPLDPNGSEILTAPQIFVGNSLWPGII